MSIEIVREEPARCEHCGTVGPHYCPADRDTGETDPEEQAQ